MTSNKTILVTGSKGFVGRLLVKQLVDLGYQVSSIDIDDCNISTDRLSLTGISHIFHLASKVYVPDSWEKTFDFYQTNVMGTVNVLELCRANQCELTYISSYVYGSPQYLPVDEKHPILPASPYNHSKLIAEDICKYYNQTFNIPIAILRPVNIYGPGQNANFLIPEIIQQVMDKSKEYIEVMDLRPRRDYLYVGDFIDALIATLDITTFETFNIGSGYSVSVEEIINTIMKVTDISKPVRSKNIERKNEVWDVYMNIQKFKDTFHWEPKTAFEEGLSRCINVK
jgi:nucleoside-diphosphate-sugar epimerase